MGCPRWWTGATTSGATQHSQNCTGLGSSSSQNSMKRNSLHTNPLFSINNEITPDSFTNSHLTLYLTIVGMGTGEFGLVFEFAIEVTSMAGLYRSYIALRKRAFYFQKNMGDFTCDVINSTIRGCSKERVWCWYKNQCHKHRDPCVHFCAGALCPVAKQVLHGRCPTAFSMNDQHF